MSWSMTGLSRTEWPEAHVFLQDASNFESLKVVGYRVLTALFDPPTFLADQSPSGGVDGNCYYQNALKGWEEGRFYLWPGLQVAAFFSFMHGFAHLLVNWGNLVRLLADEDYVKNSPLYGEARIRMFLTDVSVPFVSGAVGGLLMYLLVVKGLWSWHHQPQAS